jgi:hypothetical protein
MQIKARSSVIGAIPRPETEARNGCEPAVRSSVKLPRGANDNLIDRTIALWQPRLRRDLSREDARQIAENVTGFFSILHEWSRASGPAPNNDNCAGSGSDEPGRPKGQGSGS